MPAANQDRDQLTAAVGRVGRRVRLNQTLQEAAWAAAIALLGPVLLLLAGRQWFAWPLLLLFVLAGVAFAGWRLYRRRPTPYQVSQSLDFRLATQDQISTAIYFLDTASTAAAEQRRAAAGLAASAPIEDVFPVAAPRSLYALAGVLAVASTLCAIRFFLEKPFRVDQPLARVIQQALNPNGTPPQHPQAPHEQLQAKNQPHGIPIETPESLIAADRQPGEDPAKPGAAATSDPEPGRPPSGNPEEASTSDPFGEPGAGDRDDMPIQSYEDMLERDAKNGLSKPDTKQGNNQDSSSNSNQAASAEANSLLSKLREAMNNMLSKLQQKPQGNGKQQAQGSPSNSGEQQEGKGEGQQGSGQPQPGGEQGTEGEGAESDQQATGQGASAKSGAKASDGGQKGSSGDGAGQQDGDKAIQDALQQEALGKLTELFGRRAQNVTGEVTVEAQSGKQSLRTPLSAKQGAHRDAGGQVSRDEIPLAYQAYIKEYFSKIRQTEKK